MGFQFVFLVVCARKSDFGAVVPLRCVQTLDLKSTVVKQMIEMSLRPFLIEEDFSVETEAFDFCRVRFRAFTKRMSKRHLYALFA